jgi:hypothetical protein
LAILQSCIPGEYSILWSKNVMRNRLLVCGLVLSIARLLMACVPIGEGEWIPVLPGGGGGGSVPVQPPAPPKVPPAVPPLRPTVQPTIVPTMMPIAEDETNIPGVREVHAVANEDDCRRMADTFAKQGRNLRLVRASPNNGTILPWNCLFEGPDASTDVFQDHRSR